MTEKNNLRKTFGEYLDKLGGKAKNLVVLDSDLGNGLYTLYFAKSYPERHFSVGQAESSMLAEAAGMTVRKKIPFVCAEAPNLLGKSLDMLINAVAAPNLNIKIILSNVGLGNIESGQVKTCTDDLAILQAIPNLKIFTPADHYELRTMMDFMINDYGPTVLRLCHQCHENIFDSNYQFVAGKPQVINQGDQICLISQGALLQECLQAAVELQRKGLTTRVINLSSLVPLEEEELLNLCQDYELIITVEDHNLHGGIGTRVTELLYRSGRVKKLIKLGLDNLPDCGKYDEILTRNKISAKSIYETVRENWLNF
jgi:transketolase